MENVLEYDLRMWKILKQIFDAMELGSLYVLIYIFFL